MEEFDTEYGKAMGNINEKFEKYMGESSGWVLDSINAIYLNIARYNPIKGSSHINNSRIHNSQRRRNITVHYQKSI